MSHSAPEPARTPGSFNTPSLAPSLPPVASLSFASALAVLGAILLIVPEIWLLAAAAIWAVDGLLGLSTAGDLILVTAIAPLCLWASWMTIRLAVAAERDPENDL